jgi:spermidine synthase
VPSSETLPAELVADLSRPHARVLYVDGLASSHVDLRDPQRLHMDYQWRLGAALDALRPERGAPVGVVHLGGGALALPRFVAATRPRARQRVFEIDEALVVLARRELGGRKLGLRCVDAAEGLARVEHADVVIGDTFAGTEIPPHLATPEFTADVARVLGDGGLYLLNVIDTPPWEVSTRHERMLRDAFAHVAVFGAREVVAKRRGGNVLFAASPARLRREALSRALASGAFAGSVR